MLTVKEAADKLGVSETRVRAMANDKTLSAVKSGRQWYVYEWSVDERLASPAKAGRPKKAERAEALELPGAGELCEAQNPYKDEVALARDLYEQCEHVFAAATDPDFLFQLPTHEEREFAVCLANFFMARKQCQLIEEGVF